MQFTTIFLTLKHNLRHDFQALAYICIVMTDITLLLTFKN